MMTSHSCSQVHLEERNITIYSMPGINDKDRISFASGKKKYWFELKDNKYERRAISDVELLNGNVWVTSNLFCPEMCKALIEMFAPAIPRHHRKTLNECNFDIKNGVVHAIICRALSLKSSDSSPLSPVVVYPEQIYSPAMPVDINNLDEELWDIPDSQNE